MEEVEREDRLRKVFLLLKERGTFEKNQKCPEAVRLKAD
jgi:hypothetical protein